VSGERYWQSFRQTKSKPIENRSLHGISTNYAAQARLTLPRGGGGEPDVVALDGGLGLELGEKNLHRPVGLGGQNRTSEWPKTCDRFLLG
jgi:hypothetical protein